MSRLRAFVDSLSDVIIGTFMPGLRLTLCYFLGFFADVAKCAEAETANLFRTHCSRLRELVFPPAILGSLEGLVVGLRLLGKGDYYERRYSIM